MKIEPHIILSTPKGLPHAKRKAFDLDNSIIADAQIIHREICPGTFHDCHETNGKCIRAAKAIHYTTQGPGPTRTPTCQCPNCNEENN